MSLNFLQKNSYVLVEPDPNEARTKLVRLSPKGREARREYGDQLRAVEVLWGSRFGKEAINDVRGSLQQVVGHSHFSEGLVPHAEGWRARKPYVTQTNAFVNDPRMRLPHYPMVLHRGGWPDGS